MKYVLDTHALVWFLAKDKRLGDQAKEIIQDPQSSLVVPAIVLAKVKHVASRRPVPVSFPDVLSVIAASPN